MGLTAKQARFVEEYLVDCNGAAAARRAGYSVHRADRQAQENLRKPAVAAAISEAQAKRAERMEITADWVLERLREEATRHGPDSSQAARVRALQLLGLHLGLFTKRVEVSGTNGQPIRVTRELSDAELEDFLAVRCPQPDSGTTAEPTIPPKLLTAAPMASDDLPDSPTGGNAL
jgi:phage terminase small subunit